MLKIIVNKTSSIEILVSASYFSRLFLSTYKNQSVKKFKKNLKEFVSTFRRVLTETNGLNNPLHDV